LTHKMIYSPRDQSKKWRGNHVKKNQLRDRAFIRVRDLFPCSFFLWRRYF